MVWTYNSPLTKDERNVKNFLQKNLKQTQHVEKIVKLFSVIVYLKHKKFKSPAELRSNILLKKGTPLFDEATSFKVYKALSTKKFGGSVSEYPYANHVIHKILEYLKSYDSIGVSSLIETGANVIQFPVRGAKTLIGEGNYEIASGVGHGIIETGVSGVNGVSEIIGGPIGFAIVGIFTGIAAGVGSLIAVLEGDFAQSLVHLINFIPGIGPAIIKMLNKMEKVQRDVTRHRKEIEASPLISSVVQTVFPLELKDSEEKPEEKPEEKEKGGLRRHKTRRNVHRFQLFQKKTKRIRRSHRRS